MAMEGLLALVCAGAVITASPLQSAGTNGEDHESGVATALAIQAAMQQGREYLLRHDPKSAVEVLESQLVRINGNPTYLGLLREAYQAYVTELRLHQQDADADKYGRLLFILEHGPVKPKVETVVHAAALEPTSKVIARAKSEDEIDNDPFQGRRKIARDLLAKADEEFGNSRFHQAKVLYDQVNQEDKLLAQSSASRWAYCKLDYVVEQLNKQSTAYLELEKEVQEALKLAPQMKFAGYLLSEINKRRESHPETSGLAGNSKAGEILVRDLGPNGEGWSVAETTNFRIFHNQPHDLVEQTAHVAEFTRAEMVRKWFGNSAEPWTNKCELYLHATGEDYNRATGVPATSPGHSSFRLESGRLVGRRIDLHCDDINLLVAVLPHETTHTVLAGNFGEQSVPRWADEGMAVLTEPREKIERHLHNLPKHYQEGQLFTVRQIMQMKEYPEARYIGPFYAESVSLVEFLTNKQGPEVFSQFVRDGLREGYETALQKHYHYRDFEDLERDWTHQVLGVTNSSGYAQGSR